MTAAVIFVPATVVHVATYTTQCMDYCTARGYEFAGLVTTNWAAVLATLVAREASVVVVARPDHLDPQREPRIEVADQPPARAVPPRNAGPVPRRQRRPNQI